jgi:hypothetical protein
MNRKFNILILMLLFFSSPLHAADIESPQKMELDPEDRELINRLTPEQLQALNHKMSDALTLYFDNSYRLAMGLFKEIAAKAGTLDVLYLLAQTAVKNNSYDVAIENYQKMLERHKDLYRVRMDLALVYFQTGDKVSAINELHSIIRSDAPEAIRGKCLIILERTKTEESRLRIFANNVFSIQYDDNINAQPDDHRHGPITSPKQKEDYAHSFNVNANLLYDIGDKNGFAFAGKFLLYDIRYLENDLYNFLQTDLSTGMSFASNSYRFQMPVGIVYREYAQDHLSTSYYIAPEINKPFSKEFNLRLMYRWESERYEAATNRPQDNCSTSVTLTPSFRFAQHGELDYFSLNLGHSLHNANLGRNSYKDITIGPSYLKKWGNGYEASLSYNYTFRAYEGNVSVSGSSFPDNRHDQRSGYSMLINRNMGKMTVSFSYSRYLNNSNTSIYSYEKDLVGMNISVLID